jgi:A/G-specific adenine glycosylase
VNKKRQTIESRKKVCKKILHWYYNHGKTFPWRQHRTPYNVLIAELLLHKTDSKKVETVYPIFLLRFPGIYELSLANISEIKETIQNIGLFYRAERIAKLSKDVINNFKGEIPSTKKDLESLRGVGDYIANAVLCFAFKKRVPIVDTNVIRVYERVFGIKSKKTRPHTDDAIWAFAEKMLPEKSFKEYNYALLDFASEVCKAKNPKCENCLIKANCRFYSKSLKQKVL